MDAIAVTLASRGEYVGIAPLGTAFTESQAAKLKPYLRDDPDRIVIATDPDSAGWQSAQRAFWRLAALRANPQHFALPEGIDPADILRTRARRRSPSASPPRPGSPNCSSSVLLESDFQPTLTLSHESISAGNSRGSSVRFPPKSGWRTASTWQNFSTCRRRPCMRKSSRQARGGPTTLKPASRANSRWYDRLRLRLPGLAQPKAFAEAAQSTNSSRRPSPHRPACTSACSHHRLSLRRTSPIRSAPWNSCSTGAPSRWTRQPSAPV